MFKARSHCSARDRTVLAPQFLISGHNVENVLTWPHLGHVLSSNMLNDEDISAHRNKFIGQANMFLCNFSKINVSVPNTLFKIHGSSHYGAELWDLTNCKIEDYCIAWRIGLRRVWTLSRDSSCLNVALVSDTVPLLGELCRRVMNFIMFKLRFSLCTRTCITRHFSRVPFHN
jgi:hypothetical protein